MQLTLHDSNLKKVGWIDNDTQDTLSYYDDLWVRDLATGTSTFTFKVVKKALRTDIGRNYLVNALNEKCFISFEYNGRDYLFHVRDYVDHRTYIELYCETLNLELLNEYANPYSSSNPKSFVEYCNAMQLLTYSFLKIGKNEIARKKLTLDFTNQETKLARILSLAKHFGAEIEFITRLKPNSTIRDFTLNVYHGHDDIHHGVGSPRNDLRISYANGLRGITKKVSKKNIFNMVVPTGKRSAANKNKTTTVLNPDGTRTITEKVTRPDGGYTTTVTIVDKSGKTLSKKTINATKNSDGTLSKSTSQNKSGTTTTTRTSTSVVTHPDKSTTRTITTVKSDGTVEKTIVHTKIEKFPDKSTKTTVRTTKPDGSITERVSIRYANGSSNTYTKMIKQGSSTKSTVVSKVDESKDDEFDLSGLKDWSKNNQKGVKEFYKRGVALYAPLSMQMYPSTFTSETAPDQWTRKDIEIEADSEEELNGKALAELEKYCYPEIIYDIDGFIDGEIGDSVIAEDEDFSSFTLIKGRISKQSISFTNPTTNKTEVANIRAIERLLSAGIQNRLDSLIEEAKPYTIRLESDNGVAFKNGQGTSNVYPTLLKGAFEVEEGVSFAWNWLDTDYIGNAFTIKGSDVNQTAVLTVTAMVGAEEVAKSVLTFTNVADGAKGAGVQSVKVMSKLSNTVETVKSGDFTTTKPNPTKEAPYVISYLETTLTDGSKTESDVYVSETRNPEFDKLAESVQSAKNDAGEALSKALELNQTVSQVQLNVDEANKKIESKVSQSDFDAVSGRLQTAETTIVEQAGEIEKRLTSVQVEDLLSDKDFATSEMLTNTTLETSQSFERRIAEAEAKIPTDTTNRNLLTTGDATPSSILYGSETYPTVRQVSTYPYNSTAKQAIEVVSGEKYTFSKKTKAGLDNYWRVSYLDANHAYVSRFVSQDDVVTVTIPPNVKYIWVSYPDNADCKIEKGSKATPFNLSVNDMITVKSFNEVKDTVSSHTQTIASLDNNTLKKAEVSITSEGIMTTVGKTVNGQTLATMIAQRADWVEIIANLLKVKGDMIVNGAITADKLNVTTLSAIIADLGTINAGLIEFVERVPGGDGESEIMDSRSVQDVDSTGKPTTTARLVVEPYPAYDKKTTLRPGVFESYGQPLMSNAEPFENQEYDPNIWSNMVVENGRIYFNSKNPSGKMFTSYIRQLKTGGLGFISANRLEITASNYTKWYQFPNKTKYKLSGDDVILDFDITPNSTGNLRLCALPSNLTTNADLMLTITSWTGEPTRLQVNKDGSIYIINAISGKRYRSQVRWTL